MALVYHCQDGYLVRTRRPPQPQLAQSDTRQSVEHAGSKPASAASGPDLSGRPCGGGGAAFVSTTRCGRGSDRGPGLVGRGAAAASCGSLGRPGRRGTGASRVCTRPAGPPSPTTPSSAASPSGPLPAVPAAGLVGGGRGDEGGGGLSRLMCGPLAGSRRDGRRGGTVGSICWCHARTPTLTVVNGRSVGRPERLESAGRGP